MVLNLEGLLLHRTACRGRLYRVVGYPVPELSGKVRELNELRARKGKIESSLTRRSGCASAGTTTEPVQMDLRWVWFDYTCKTGICDRVA
jgi:hypothetical protein